MTDLCSGDTYLCCILDLFKKSYFVKKKKKGNTLKLMSKHKTFIVVSQGLKNIKCENLIILQNDLFLLKLN